MCGRYAASRSPDDLAEEFEVDRVDPAARERLVPDWNVAPTKDVPAVLARPRRDAAGRPTAQVERRLTALRWGLVPSWARDASGAARLINARAETAGTKPAFRRALAARRCLLPADGWYEWVAVAGGGARKQPWYLSPADGGVLAMAGLYELWRDPTAGDGPDALRWTCAVLTTRAEDALGHVHDRMPLLVDRHRWQEWLDPARPGAAGAAGSADVRELLVPAVTGRVVAVPVGPEVGDVRRNGPQLVQPALPAAAPLGAPALDALF